jgi:RHS repeat-associated protein
MQARYYDPVNGRFYSNDPVDALGHMQRGNSIAHGFNRYAYANNNPYKYTDPDGEFGLIGFAIGFTADAIGQYVTTGKVNVTQSLISGAVGAVTGGLASVAKTSLSVGGKVVASQSEKILAGAMVASGTATTGAGAYAVNESLSGSTPTGGDTAVAGLMSVAGPGKSVSGAMKKVAEFAQDTFSSLDNVAADVAVDLTSKSVSKTVDSELKEE